MTTQQPKDKELNMEYMVHRISIDRVKAEAKLSYTSALLDVMKLCVSEGEKADFCEYLKAFNNGFLTDRQFIDSIQDMLYPRLGASELAVLLELTKALLNLSYTNRI